MLLAVVLLSPIPRAVAQPPGMGPSPVGFTEAREHGIGRSLRLTGSVETRRVSIVASEVAGLVTALLAREGDSVRRGQPLARLRRTNLEQQLAGRQASLREAEARLKLALRTLERSEELFASEVISRQLLDDATSEKAAWQGRVESLQAEIAQVEDDLSRSVVSAPFSGVVVEEHTQTGQWVSVGGPVVELMDLDVLEVVLQVPEQNFAGLKKGSSTRVRFPALEGLELEGKIHSLIPRADPETRTFPVKVRVANEGHRVGVGMMAEVELPVGERTRALIVPKDAVVQKGSGRFVYRIGTGETVEEVPVTVGKAAGAWLEIRGGVKAGDRIVTRGNERLFPGMAVKPSPVRYELP